MSALQVSSWRRVSTALQIFVHFPPQVVLKKNIQTNSDQLFFIFLCGLCVENRKHNNSERNFAFVIFFLPFYLCYLYFYHNLWSTVVFIYSQKAIYEREKANLLYFWYLSISGTLCFSVLWKLITVDLLSKMGRAIPIKYFLTTSAANGTDEQTNS